jgi:hypothetical protein
MNETDVFTDVAREAIATSREHIDRDPATARLVSQALMAVAIAIMEANTGPGTGVAEARYIASVFV